MPDCWLENLNSSSSFSTRSRLTFVDEAARDHLGEDVGALGVVVLHRQRELVVVGVADVDLVAQPAYQAAHGDFLGRNVRRARVVDHPRTRQDGRIVLQAELADDTLEEVPVDELRAYLGQLVLAAHALVLVDDAALELAVDTRPRLDVQLGSRDVQRAHEAHADCGDAGDEHHR
jgi:hypothetical protein